MDGIYRISGVASHIRYLRYEFDSDHQPDFEQLVISLPKAGRVPGMSRDGGAICDPHSIAGLCKLYFRYVDVVAQRVGWFVTTSVNSHLRSHALSLRIAVIVRMLVGSFV